MGNSESAIKKANFDDVIMISKELSKNSAKKTQILIHVMDKDDEDINNCVTWDFSMSMYIWADYLSGCFCKKSMEIMKYKQIIFAKEIF